MSEPNQESVKKQSPPVANQNIPSGINRGGNLTIWLLTVVIVLLVVLVVLYYYNIYSTKSPNVSQSLPVTSQSTTNSNWQTYSIVPDDEEEAEAGQAAKFTIAYPAGWQYKDLDAEAKESNAGTLMHEVGFSDESGENIYLMTARVRVVAETADYDKAIEVIVNAHSGDIEKTESTTRAGQKMTRLVPPPFEDQSDDNMPVTYFIQSPSDWILTIEGGSDDLVTLDYMAKSVTF